MSDRTHKILASLAALLFAVAGALMHAHRFPALDWLWQVIMEVTGGGGLLALRPLAVKGKDEEPKADMILPGELGHRQPPGTP